MTIPAELLEIPQWVAWRWEVRDGKRTKIPVNPKTGENASSTNPATWGTHAEAATRHPRDGVGFVVTPSDPYCGIDIDHCYDGTNLDPQAKELVDRFASYTEITPSGQGVRIWIKAKLTRRGNKKHLENGVTIEFYDKSRYFTVTGHGGRVTEIHDRQTELDALHLGFFPEQARPAQAGPFRGAGLSLSDLDLLTKARSARNGDKFDRLWAGDTGDYAGDDSSADLALLCHLAFWTGRDAVQMDRLFRQSQLYRPKWEREDYRLRSIEAANSRTIDIWTPGTPAATAHPVEPEPTAAAQTEDGQSIAGLIEIDDLSDAIDRYYETGAKNGESPGWPSLANLYRIQRGEWTLVTGMPTSGKSSWLDALIFNLIDTLGWRFGICSPENQPLERHFAQLAEKLIGQSFSGPNRMDIAQKDFAKSFLREYVSFILPDAPTIEAVLETASRAISRRGLDGLVVDPWNEIEHSRPHGYSESEYISVALSRFRRFARQHAIHLWLVAHPTKLEKEQRFGEDGKPLIRDGRRVMTYPVPDPYSVSGSSHWRNKADNCVTVHRDPEGDSNVVQIHVQKIRFKQNGRQGVAILHYQQDSGRFEDSGIWWRVGREVSPTTARIADASAEAIPAPQMVQLPPDGQQALAQQAPLFDRPDDDPTDLTPPEVTDLQEFIEPQDGAAPFGEEYN